MASRHFTEMQALTKRLTVIAGNFVCNGTAAPTVLSGSGFKVLRTGVGLYTIQLDDNYNAVSDASASIVAATAGVNSVSKLTTFNTSATPGGGMTLKIGATATPATGADITQTGGDSIFFSMHLRNSSIPS